MPSNTFTTSALGLMPHRVKKLLIDEAFTVKEALKQMSLGSEKVLFVVNDACRLLGTLTDGDIRRWILKEGDLTATIQDVYNQKPKTLGADYDIKKVKKLMLDNRIEALPILDPARTLTNALFWSDIFSDKPRMRSSHLNVPVIIMAGGKGTRLDPFTRILPKPLIPIGEKPIIEVVMEQFARFGCEQFYVTVNYKGKMIQSYFENAECLYQIKLIWEENPLGTAGGLRNASKIVQGPHLFVSNCDVLITADYSDIFHFHESEGNDITVVGSLQHLQVPYGVLEIKNGGHLQNIIEKPEYDMLVNTGMYVIQRRVIDHIPPGKVFHFTDLIMSVKNAGGKVQVYPVPQEAWVDIGKWQDYHNTVKKFNDEA